MPRRDKRFYRRPDGGAFLYAISAGGVFIKFGFATSPVQRVMELQVGSAYHLRLLASIAAPDRQSAKVLEDRIHVAVARYHVRGEWFHSCPKTLAVAELMKLDLAAFDQRMSEWTKSEVHYALKRAQSNVKGTLARF